jgi:hypothetical protein
LIDSTIQLNSLPEPHRSKTRQDDRSKKYSHRRSGSRRR